MAANWTVDDTKRPAAISDAGQPLHPELLALVNAPREEIVRKLLETISASPALACLVNGPPSSGMTAPRPVMNELATSSACPAESSAPLTSDAAAMLLLSKIAAAIPAASSDGDSKPVEQEENAAITPPEDAQNISTSAATDLNGDRAQMVASQSQISERRALFQLDIQDNILMRLEREYAEEKKEVASYEANCRSIEEDEARLCKTVEELEKQTRAKRDACEKLSRQRQDLETLINYGLNRLDIKKIQVREAEARVAEIRASVKRERISRGVETAPATDGIAENQSLNGDATLEMEVDKFLLTAINSSVTGRDRLGREDYLPLRDSHHKGYDLKETISSRRDSEWERDDRDRSRQYFMREREREREGKDAKDSLPEGSARVVVMSRGDGLHGAPADFAVLIYNVEDEDRFKNKTTGSAVICDSLAIDSGACSINSTKAFIIQDTTAFTSPTTNEFRHYVTDQADMQKITYTIERTGLYCVLIEPIPSTAEFSAEVTLENPYGKLPGADYPKLPFFGLLSITYLLLGFAWFIKSWMHWKDLLMLQHYVTAVIFFLMIEMAFNYGYFEDYNRWGRSNTKLLVVTALPTLGSAMQKCLVLAYTHFVFGVVYAAGSMIVSDVTPFLALVFAFPLSAAMTAFYFFILQTLEAKRQAVKLVMYQRLWQTLVFSVFLLLVFFVINMYVFSKREDPAWVPTQWSYRWLNILYLVVFVSIALLWRPTDNNARYGLEQLATEDPDEEDGAYEDARGGVRVGIKLRAVSRHDDDDEVGESTANEEPADDIFRWVEENVGEAERDVGDAILASPEGGGNLLKLG
ncbi:hypothetical protein HK101_004337 [Irineochytrium annulatum]|nr:hypothetical protein HK101_004337 [Irineochytrium annulatum]